MNESESELVWKALADTTRRRILDVLAERPHTTGELVELFDQLCRTNVMKHVDLLVKANLVIIRREGRTRWNHLNPVPIQSVCDRWVSRHVRRLSSSLGKLKEHLESDSSPSNTESARSEPPVKSRKKSTSKSKKKGSSHGKRKNS